MKHQHKKCSGSGKHGYTLMEMLIAAVLIAALMSVIWGMMSMYNAYLTAGRKQAVERQLVRALFQTISDDIQNLAVTDSNPKIQLMTESVTEQSSERPSQNSEVSSANESLALIEEARELRSLEVLRPPANARIVSLHGSDSVIRISYIDTSGVLSSNPSSALTPNPEMTQETAESTAPRVPEFRTVIWYFRSPAALSAEEGSVLQNSGLYRITTSTMHYAMSQATDLQSVDRSSAGDGSLSGNPGAVSDLTEQPADGSGLNPLELLLQPDSQPTRDAGPGEPAREPVELESIPEVVSCQFEFFSGSAWQDQWNSEASQGLPLAVRMKLRIVDADQVDQFRTLLQGSSSSSEPSLSSDTFTNPETLSGSAPTIDARKFERTILLQPVRASMPMLEDGLSSGSSDFTAPSFSGGSQP